MRGAAGADTDTGRARVEGAMGVGVAFSFAGLSGSNAPKLMERPKGVPTPPLRPPLPCTTVVFSFRGVW